MVLAQEGAVSTREQHCVFRVGVAAKPNALKQKALLQRDKLDGHDTIDDGLELAALGLRWASIKRPDEGRCRGGGVSLQLLLVQPGKQ